MLEFTAGKSVGGPPYPLPEQSGCPGPKPDVTRPLTTPRGLQPQEVKLEITEP